LPIHFYKHLTETALKLTPLSSGKYDCFGWTIFLVCFSFTTSFVDVITENTRYILKNGLGTIIWDYTKRNTQILLGKHKSEFDINYFTLFYEKSRTFYTSYTGIIILLKYFWGRSVTYRKR
jgi:hypothetical protein